MKSLTKYFLISIALFSYATFGQEIVVKVKNFEANEAVQKTPLWCWAACAEMALKSGGADISQETIVNAIKGRLVVQGASNAEITAALNAVGFNKDSSFWRAQAITHRGAPVPSWVISELRANRPIIVSYPTGPYSSHVVMMHKATYINTPIGPAIGSVVIFDPYTGRDSTVDGRMVPFQTLDCWYVKVTRAEQQEERNKSSQRGSLPTGEWKEVDYSSADIEISSTPNWGDKRSGSVTIRSRVKNTSSSVTYKVELTAASVKIDRSSRDVTGEIDSQTKTSILEPDSSKTISFSLQWATTEWQPTPDEMPGVHSPEKESQYGKVRIWEKVTKNKED